MITLDGERLPWKSGMTISHLLQEIADDHQYAVIKLNGRYVSRPSFDTHVIPDNAEIFLIPMIAGG